MNPSLFDKFRELVASPAESGRVDGSRPHPERFALPHTFKPQLSLGQAVISAGGALLRIFFGSLLFAVWGTYSLFAWSAIPNLFLRGAALVALLVLFAGSMTLLMVVVAALVRLAWPHREQRP